MPQPPAKFDAIKLPSVAAIVGPDGTPLDLLVTADMQAAIADAIEGIGAGNTILYGTAAPTTEGNNGDFYIRTTTNFIYGPKASGTWPSGTSLVGPTGATGATGATGSAGATGATGAAGPNTVTTSTTTNLTGVLFGNGTTVQGSLTKAQLDASISDGNAVYVGDAAYDFLSTLSGAEISITGATTATISRMHVCSGTSADYTVTLPAVSGNTGKFIGFRMSSALTKLVTLDGNASETIDGATTRIMWANETAILFCDGTAWTKVSGKTIAMVAKMQKSTSQSISNTTMTKILCNASVFDNTGLMVRTGSNDIICVRGGTYNLTAAVRYGPTSALMGCEAQIYVASASVAVQTAFAVPSGQYPGVQVGVSASLSVGSVVDVRTFHNAGSSQGLYVGEPHNFVQLIEVPSW